MLILDLTSGRFSETNMEQHECHPDLRHEPNWNLELTDLQSVQSTNAEAWKPAPAVIGAGLEWLDRN